MSESRIDTYAEAFVALAEAEGVLGQVEAELYSVSKSIQANEQLRGQLTDELVSVVQRQKVLETLLAGRTHSLTAQFISFVIGAGRARDLEAIVEKVSAAAAGKSDRNLAVVRSAVALTDDQQKRLADALAKATGGKTVNLKVVVDPSVVGGIVATVGDQVIDGSVRSRLDQVKSRL